MVSPLLPLLLSAAYFNDLERPTSPRLLLDQDFGLGIRPEQLMLSRYGFSLPSTQYYRPWADLLRQESNGGGISSISLDKDGFKVILDVQQFKPEEIELKVVDKQLIVSAKHEEKKDEHGLISRQFVRRYVIPENVEEDKITSQISSDGVLTIQAPVKDIPEEDKNVRKIKIEYTGKPALKQNKAEEERKEDGAASTTTSSASTTSSTTEGSTTPEKWLKSDL